MATNFHPGSSDQYKINWLGSYLQGIAQSWHLVRDTQMKREGVLDTWTACPTEFQEYFKFKDEAEERRNAVKAYKKAVRASKIAAESIQEHSINSRKLSFSIIKNEGCERNADEEINQVQILSEYLRPTQ
ncbi:hypothetical protein E4U17_003450 [Claviceps sp. LM77 group G4]|nr:hypothetical protein E4U17_003450 [Claviceps sp. LM77 group G4]KAG6080602.1 hypothetical protein E4U16_000179 [Claviceps sp. LM84 group G4]KAG6085780.1 hypothetical protein E4U33_001115 [Claviceps sp. LM78 group G4]